MSFVLRVYYITRPSIALTAYRRLACHPLQLLCPSVGVSHFAPIQWSLRDVSVRDKRLLGENHHIVSEPVTRSSAHIFHSWALVTSKWTPARCVDCGCLSVWHWVQMSIPFGSRPFRISVRWKSHVLRFSEVRRALTPVSWDMRSSFKFCDDTNTHERKDNDLETSPDLRWSRDRVWLRESLRVQTHRRISNICRVLPASAQESIEADIKDKEDKQCHLKGFFQNLLAVFENKVKDLHLLFLCCSVFWGLLRRLQRWILGRQKHVACF